MMFNGSKIARFYGNLRFVYVLSLILSALVALQCLPAFSVSAAEVPEASYIGADDAQVILKNLQYTDIQGAGDIVKLAVYETGALELTKRYGSRQYGLDTILTKEDALAAVYIAVGREASAQAAGEALNNSRAAADKKTDPLAIWNDGYLALAAKDKLISKQDLADALNKDQNKVPATGFHRYDSAQRQEVADWLAKVLKLSPSAGQKKLFNSYSDWQTADEARIPNIEAVLQKNIMSGDGNGRFLPKNPVTRGQMALVVWNAESVLLPVRGLDKKLGTVEDIRSTKDITSGSGLITTTFDIRNSDGMLHRITTTSTDTKAAASRADEKNGSAVQDGQIDLVVYGGGNPGLGVLLKKGDRIEYITSPDASVRFVHVISNTADTKYIGALVNNIDTAKHTISVTRLFAMKYPDIAAGLGSADFNPGEGSMDTVYRYSNSIPVTVDGVKSDISHLTAGSSVILTVRGDNIVVEAKTADFKVNDRQAGLVEGIVEENNTSLGYITLYNEDGTGADSETAQQPLPQRTFYYSGQGPVEAYRNQAKVDISAIEPGDTVFLKLDGEGNVESANSAENYSVSYATVTANRNGNLALILENGDNTVVSPGASAVVISGGKVVPIKSIGDGDRIRMLYKITPSSMIVKEIDVESAVHLITNIYKGKVADLNMLSGTISLLTPKVLDHGTWSGTSFLNRIKMDDKCLFYAGGIQIDTRLAGKYYSNSEAYIAVEKGFDGLEHAVVVSFRDASATENIPYKDVIAGTVPGTGRFSLGGAYGVIGYDKGSIVVKDGRLVDGGSIWNDDSAVVVANKDTAGKSKAAVVKIDSKADTSALKVYRGRLSAIDDGRSFTVESYSVFGPTGWDFYNSPKTFTITGDTGLLTDQGVTNPNQFTGYGDGKYTGKFVYIVSDGGAASLISTAPFDAGSVVTRGTIYNVSGAQYGDDGTITQEPGIFYLRGVKNFNTATRAWDSASDLSVVLYSGSSSGSGASSGSTTASASNCVIIKDGAVIKPSGLSKLDVVRVFRAGTTAQVTSGSSGSTAAMPYTAYVIVVDN